MFNKNKRLQGSAHTQTRMAHRPSDCGVMRRSNGLQKRAKHGSCKHAALERNDGNKVREDTIVDISVICL